MSESADCSEPCNMDILRGLGYASLDCLSCHVAARGVSSVLQVVDRGRMCCRYCRCCRRCHWYCDVIAVVAVLLDLVAHVSCAKGRDFESAWKVVALRVRPDLGRGKAGPSCETPPVLSCLITAPTRNLHLALTDQAWRMATMRRRDDTPHSQSNLTSCGMGWHAFTPT